MQIFYFIISGLCVLPFQCLAADGFAAAVAGGTGGEIIRVTDASSFKKYAEAQGKYIIALSGTIDLTSVKGKIRIKPDKTIAGTDANATLIGNLTFDSESPSANVIIRNLNITNPGSLGEGDGITIRKVNNVFITKCTLYDCADGCIDITNRADNVTVSWCKFYYTDPNYGHRFVNLIGASDDSTSDFGSLRVTMHHNWWSTNCDQRMPRVRFGKVHIYNNYYDCPRNSYCNRAAISSQLLIENNFFRRVNNPYYLYITEGTKGKIKVSGNIFEHCTGKIDEGTDEVFSPPYEYELDPADNVPAIVTASAGNVWP